MIYVRTKVIAVAMKSSTPTIIIRLAEQLEPYSVNLYVFRSLTAPFLGQLLGTYFRRHLSLIHTQRAICIIYPVFVLHNKLRRYTQLEQLYNQTPRAKVNHTIRIHLTTINNFQT